MFCPQCGTQLPDGSTVCTACNHVMRSARPAAPASTTPVSKTQYFWKTAPQKTKIVNIVALLLGILSVLMVVLSANKTVNGSMFKIPIISLIMDVEGASDEVDELEKEWSDAIEDAEDNLDELEDVLEDMLEISIDDVEDELGISTKKFLKLLDPISLNHIVKIADALDANDSEIISALKIVITVVNVLAVIFAAVAALGVVFQKTWLMVLSYVLSFVFILATGGIVYLLIASACFITTAVLFSKMKFEYKVYLAGFGIK